MAKRDDCLMRCAHIAESKLLLLIALAVTITVLLHMAALKGAPVNDTSKIHQTILGVNEGHDCVIPIYADFQYQGRWMMEVVASRVHQTCRCSLLHRKRSEFSRAFTEPRPFREAILVTIDMVGMELVLMNEEHARFIREHVTLVQVGDDSGHRTNELHQFYDRFKRVYREYYFDGDATRKSSLEYLRAGDVASFDDAHVKWIPLGYTQNLVRWVSPDLIHRPLLFFWAASTFERPERLLFKEALDADPDDVKALGFVHTFAVFEKVLGCNWQLVTADYSRSIHDAWLVPCPPSTFSHDQNRISEALEAAAIPIVARNQESIRYLDLLNLRHIAVSHFDNATVLLLKEAHDNTSLREQLQRDQRHNRARWQDIKDRLSIHFAHDVCAA